MVKDSVNDYPENPVGRMRDHVTATFHRPTRERRYALCDWIAWLHWQLYTQGGCNLAHKVIP